MSLHNLLAIYEDWKHNFCSVQSFAQAVGLSYTDALMLISIATTAHLESLKS